MVTSGRGTKRCSSCGDEFRAGIRRCADCDVELVDGPPARPAPARPGGRSSADDDHSTVHYDLADWAPEQRDHLEIATRWQRFLGAILDQVVTGFALVLVLMPVVVVDDRAGAWTSTLALNVGLVAYEIVCVGVWGRTIGKWIAGTRVVAHDTGGRVGWRRAFVRAAVPLLSTRAVTTDWALLGLLRGLLGVAVYVPVLWLPYRGIHDRLAGTIVVTAQRRRRERTLARP